MKPSARQQRQLLRRPVHVVAVVAAVLAGQQDVQHVVPVVVPLRVAVLLQMRGVVVVLQHQMHVAPGLDGRAHGGGHLVHPVLLLDRVHRIEAQTVESILHQPKKHVLGEEAAHNRLTEIDRRSPGRRVVLAKELRRVERQVVSVGSEMIVHDVEEDHQAKVVRRVDQRLQCVRRAVGRIGRVRQHAVVAPVAPPGEVVDRHQFDRGDAEIPQHRQSFRHAGKSAAGADVEFVKHGLAPGTPLPVRVPPRIGARIDHDARTMHVIGLRACGRIGHQRAVRQAVAIARPGGTRCARREPAIRRALHRQQRTTLQRHAHGLLRRRPEPKPRLAISRQVRARRRIAAKAIAHGASWS